MSEMPNDITSLFEAKPFITSNRIFVDCIPQVIKTPEEKLYTGYGNLPTVISNKVYDVYQVTINSIAFTFVVTQPDTFQLTVYVLDVASKNRIINSTLQSSIVYFINLFNENDFLFVNILMPFTLGFVFKPQEYISLLKSLDFKFENDYLFYSKIYDKKIDVSYD